MKLTLNYISSIAIFIIAVMMSACQDELPYDAGGDIPEGISTVSVEVAFKAFEPALGNSRAEGNAIKAINTLWVVVFDQNGENPRFHHITDFTVGTLDTNVRPDGQTSSESKTGCAKFKLTIPNGRYKMYAVANCDLSSLESTIKTPEDLKEVYFKWDSTNMGKNAQMFGWFVNGTANTDHGPDAPVVYVRSNTEPLHAWVYRAASKVTVAFNTTNLSEYVTLYIKSVTVKDIPQYCRLGKENAPGNDDYQDFVEKVPEANTLVQGETIYFAGASAADKDAKANYKKWPVLFAGDSIFGLYSDANGKAPVGMTIAQKLDREHSEAARALYFYENLQGKGEEGKESDKRQDPSGNNSQVLFPDGSNPDSPAWKDAKRYGSYIEIEGYYVNNSSSSPGQGPIKYRFMLGKDEIIDYDAERNYHYKVTLEFNGNANDVDFHIDYQEEHSPGLHVQETTYVSYLYNQESHTVLRATPEHGYDLLSLEAYIVDNEWRPHDAEYKVGQGPSDGTGTVLIDQYLYNKDAWNQQVNYTGFYKRDGGSFERPEYVVTYTDRNGTKHTTNCAKNTEFGYLSLRKVSTQIFEFYGSGSEAFVAKMRRLYFGGSSTAAANMNKSRGYRNYGNMPSTDGTTTVGTEEDGTFDISRQRNAKGVVNYVMEVPLFTRARSIDSWAVYSGANPFYRHYRKATVMFIATYKKTDSSVSGPATYQEAATTTVLQARRIDNPRTIYRSAKNTDPFEVVLCYNMLTAAEQLTHINDLDNETEIYSPIISQGPWTATIERDPHNLVSIRANGRTATRENQSVTGRSGTEIKFTYTPRHAVAEDVTEGAIITVKYHGNSCSHKIIVRQGYAPTTIGSGSSTLWSAYAVYDKDHLTVNPLSVGSTFRMHKTLDYPIAESNNTREGFMFNQTPAATAKFDILGGDPKTWSDISANSSKNDAGKSEYEFAKMTLDGKNYELPTLNNLIELGIYKDKKGEENQTPADKAMAQDIGNAFGIAYGDGAKKTLRTKRAYTFVDYDNNIKESERGVRGVTVYSLETGNNVFFSFGAWGNPRRRTKGLLQYGSVNWLLTGNANNCRPMAYDLINQIGGVYWLTGGSNGEHVAIDFNGGNYMSSYLNYADVYKTDGKADALPIKPIRK